MFKYSRIFYKDGELQTQTSNIADGKKWRGGDVAQIGRVVPG